MKPILVKQFPLLRLPLAVDARLIDTHSEDDQVWQLSFGSGETGNLELMTTYGLRAKYMRIFPVFSENGISNSEMRHFHSTPRIKRVFPNLVTFSFQPFEGVQAICDYWVQDVNIISCRVTVINHTEDHREIGMDWACWLSPEAGEPMAPVHRNIVNLLEGSTTNLHPVFFMTGNPQTTKIPKPALTHDLILNPKESRQLTWALASKETQQASYEAARLAAAKNWDAEIARIEMVNSDIYEIESFLPEWDCVFTLSQRQSVFLASMDKNEILPLRTIDSTKNNSQMLFQNQEVIFPLVLWFWLKSTPPDLLKLGKSILLNFLNKTKNQSSNYDSMPFLCTVALEIYQRDNDKLFLGKIYPSLINFYDHWITEENIESPTWASVCQTGIERHPLFSNLFSWSQGVDSKTVHAPDLTALLLIEAESMDQLALVMEDIEKSTQTKHDAMRLRNKLEDLWHTRSVIHFYSDSETKISQKVGLVLKQKGEGIKTLDKIFEDPMRLLIRVQTKGLLPLQIKIQIDGKDADGNHQSQILSYSDFSWYLNHGTLTLKKLFTEINSISINNITKDNSITIQQVYHRVPMITSLLPIWANSIPMKMKKRIIKHNFAKAKRFNENFGMPEFIPTPSLRNKIDHVSVSLPHSVLVIEGLLKMGEIKLAAEHLTKIVTAQGMCLRNQGALYERYDVKTGEGFDTPYTWNSLFPVGLFLEVAGIEIFSSTKVKINYLNPMPAKFRIGYRGLMIQHNLKETIVTFPNGKENIYQGDAPAIYEMS